MQAHSGTLPPSDVDFDLGCGDAFPDLDELRCKVELRERRDNVLLPLEDDGRGKEEGKVDGLLEHVRVPLNGV